VSRPGTTITRSDTKPARTVPTSISPWFIAGVTGTVDTLGAAGVRTPCTSLTDYATRFGNRAAHATAPELYDSVEFYFKEGGSKLFVSRTADALDATLTAALALFTRDLGPGQVSVPGRTTATAMAIIAAHAEATNRVGILDGPNTNVVATLTALATPGTITPNQERITALFAPWVVVPGVAGGANRTIPPSGIVAGLMAKNDSGGITPNQPSAGQLGISAYGLDVSQTFIDVDRTTLNANGINLLKIAGGQVRVYGYRTLANPADSVESNYLQLSNARLFMRIQAELDAIGERYIFRQIDGQRLTINEYGGVLTGALLPYWQRGSLYGTNPEDAFRVDVGPNVNTDATIANGELHASIMLRMSPFAEEVFMDLVKTRITEAI
jgi:phage tail sheath protein FI